MDDTGIINLFFERNEKAIEETQKQYGSYLLTIAKHILHTHEDAEECVNDTYVKLWGCIPPKKPTLLRPFAGRITRNLSLDRYDYLHAEKRGEFAEELDDCLAGENFEADEIALREVMNGFLASLSKKDRIVFLQRYWYFLSVAEIAENVGLGEANVKTTLFRTRNALRIYLKKEGFSCEK